MDIEKQTDLTVSGSDLRFEDWGSVDYAEAHRRQMDLVDMISHELAREIVVFCTHPPVVTLGRGTLEGDLCGWSGSIVEINRGGRATYHGPNQLLAYPILDLSSPSRKRDLHKHLRHLEEAVVRTLADFGIHATGRSQQIQDGDTEAVEATGVWVGSRKIASIGIGVRKWVTFHGLALNVDHDPDAFKGLKPCGFSAATMVSMEEILGAKPERDAVQASLEKNLRIVLSEPETGASVPEVR